MRPPVKEPPVKEPPIKAVPGPDQKKHAATRLPALAYRRAMGFPVAVAEFLLLFRLRARRRSALCADMLERAVRVMWLTCKSWFAADGGHFGGCGFTRH